MDTSKFDGIRPYLNKEIPSAMTRIADSELFPLIASYVFPNENIEDVRRHIRGIETIDQFQHDVMSVVNEQVIKRSMTSFSYNGIDRHDKNKRYLFVSNHRDIMLDSSLLQYILHIRTKDGIDHIEHGLIRTFGSSLPNDKLKALSELNNAPGSVSYEWI